MNDELNTKNAMNQQAAAAPTSGEVLKIGRAHV